MRSVVSQGGVVAMSVASNRSIELTSFSRLRLIPAAAHVKRWCSSHAVVPSRLRELRER